MLLIFHAARADGYIGKDVRDIPPVFGIEHFVGCRQAGFFKSPDVHFAHGDKALQEIFLLPGIGLMDDAFVAFAGGAGFVGINPGNEDQPVRNFFVDFGQAADIVADSVFIVRGAGSDDDQEAVAFPGNYVPDLFVAEGL